jgi:hypothetical protein
MNPLGNLPTSTSRQFSLNAIDWRHFLRLLILFAIGYFATDLAPRLVTFNYVWGGHDYTPVVVMAVTMSAEIARRFCAGAPKT